MWEILWERNVGKLAKLFGEVEFEAVVGSVLPERSNAVGSFQDDEGDAFLSEAGGDGEAGGPRSHDDWPVYDYASAGEEVLVIRCRS